MLRNVVLVLLLIASTPLMAMEIVTDPSGLKRAVRDARKGDVIVLREGLYDVTDLKIDRDLVLRGEGQVVLFSSRPVAKGLLNPVRDASLRVENLTFRNARSPDRNGAGIRHDGRNLDVVNCVFENNENGILATGDHNGVIEITGSRFLRSGHGDGYSHGVYFARAKKVEITDSVFTATRIGHHIKSLARETIIRSSRLDDGDGRTSYAIDLSNGGSAYIVGNVIIQADSAENVTMINFDESRGGKAQALIIRDNTIINRRRNGRFLRNGSSITPMVFDNDISVERGASLDYEEIRPEG